MSQRAKHQSQTKPSENKFHRGNGEHPMAPSERTLRYQHRKKARGLCVCCGKRPFEKDKKHLNHPLCSICAENSRTRRRKYSDGQGNHRLEQYADYLRLDKKSRIALAAALRREPIADYASKMILRKRGILDGSHVDPIARKLFTLTPCGVAVFREVVKYHRAKCKQCQRTGMDRQRTVNAVLPNANIAI